MTTAELKNYLHKIIVENDDVDFLESAKEFVDSLTKRKTLSWESLPPHVQKSISKGATQIKNGEGISHDTVMKKYSKWV